MILKIQFEVQLLKHFNPALTLMRFEIDQNTSTATHGSDVDPQSWIRPLKSSLGRLK